MTKIIETMRDVGWTQAQELNAEGWTIGLAGADRSGVHKYEVFEPMTDELEFNTRAREFIKCHRNERFDAWREIA